MCMQSFDKQCFEFKKKSGISFPRELFRSNYNTYQLFQLPIKRKLSRNGWDTKHGYRRRHAEKTKLVEMDQDGRTDSVSTSFDRRYIKSFIPFYKMVSWV